MPPCTLARSDNLIDVREITATEAARAFSGLLDSVEHKGETFLVTRAGRPVARIEPALGTSGTAVKALLRHYPADARWRRELDELRQSVTTQERAWPD
jgi:prevent-host-death family protein